MTVTGAVSPGKTWTTSGTTESEKSGGGWTTIVAFALRTTGGPAVATVVAVAVNGSVPFGAAAETVKNTSTDPPVAGNGAVAGAAVTFGIAGIASVVAAFHPFSAVMVNVIFPVAPGTSVSVTGLAVSVKSGGGGTMMFSVTVRVPERPRRRR